MNDTWNLFRPNITEPTQEKCLSGETLLPNQNYYSILKTSHGAIKLEMLAFTKENNIVTRGTYSSTKTIQIEGSILYKEELLLSEKQFHNIHLVNGDILTIIHTLHI